MKGKSLKVVIFSVVLLGGILGGVEFYKSFPKDEDVIKEFVLSPLEESKGEAKDESKNEQIEEVTSTTYEIENKEKDKIEDAEKPSIVNDKIHKSENLETQSIDTNLKKEHLGEMYSAMSSDSITVNRGDDDYLTNKSVIVEVKGNGPSTITIGGQTVEGVGTESGAYSYVFKVSDNVTITAGSASKTVQNIVTVSTGLDGGETGKKYAKDKNGTVATIGGKITGASGVTLSSTNIKEHGVRYWRADMEDEIYTAKTTSVGKSVSSLKYEVKVSSLKENTTYYMQAYMVNKLGEVILGDVKEFSTRGQGSGLYRLCYDATGNVKKISQERKSTMDFVASDFSYNGKVKWVGEIIPVNNGVMRFRVTSPSGGSIQISDETKTFSGGTKEFTTTNIYEVGKRYPIIMEFTPAGTIKVEWKEDGEYQVIPKEQLYPKEYAKIVSAVVNSVGTDNQKINKTTGKLVGKKVVTNGQNMSKINIVYNSSNDASTITIGGKSYTIDTECKIEGCIIYNTNNVVEPITKNVSEIDYANKKVTLRNKSAWDLYKSDGVDIVGRAIITKENNKEVYKVYDLGRYITALSDKKLSDGASNVAFYRADEEDNTYILNLDNSLGESLEYQTMLEQYGTMERLVEDSKPVEKKWNTGIGDARLFSQIPIRVLLSFDGDGSFVMNDPVIKISKKLFKNKSVGNDVNSNVIFKNEEVIADEDNKFIIALPTDTSASEVSKDIYVNWKYMNKDSNGYYVESSNKNTATMRNDGEYISITLNGYSAASKLKDKVSENVVMLNFVVRLNSVDRNKTSKEIFESIKDQLIDDAYITYTKAFIDKVDGIDIAVVEVPIKIKIKPQVVFE